MKDPRYLTKRMFFEYFSCLSARSLPLAPPIRQPPDIRIKATLGQSGWEKEAKSRPSRSEGVLNKHCRALRVYGKRSGQGWWMRAGVRRFLRRIAAMHEGGEGTNFVLTPMGYRGK
jgi:hypothetical protein